MWVRSEDEREAWEPAQLVSRSGMQASVKLLRNGQRRQLPSCGPGTDQPLWSLKKGSIKPENLTPDLVMLDSLNEAMICFDLRERYKRNQIYTWVGANHSVLVS